MDQRLVLLGAVLLAALGQVLFKLGATGATSFYDYVNVRLGAGFLCYGGGAILWVYALTTMPLTRAYPYTVLTFVIVYLASAIFLGETITRSLLIGLALIFAGLYLVTCK